MFIFFHMQEFFLNIKDLTRHLQANNQPTKQFNAWSTLESILQRKFNDAQKSVHEALCDNVDTRTALDVIRELVTQTNIYIRDVATTAGATLNALLLRRIGSYVTDLLHIFGAISGPRGGIGFPVEGVSVDVRPYLHTSTHNWRHTTDFIFRFISLTVGANGDIVSECDG